MNEASEGCTVCYRSNECRCTMVGASLDRHTAHFSCSLTLYYLSPHKHGRVGPAYYIGAVGLFDHAFQTDRIGCYYCINTIQYGSLKKSTIQYGRRFYHCSSVRD